MLGANPMNDAFTTTTLVSLYTGLECFYSVEENIFGLDRITYL
jgi:hypothetical protein